MFSRKTDDTTSLPLDRCWVFKDTDRRSRKSANGEVSGKSRAANIGRDGDLLTLPTYMQFLLDMEPEEIVLEPIDANALNSLAKEILSIETS